MSTRPLLPISLALLLAASCNPFHRDPAVTVTARDRTLNTRWHANLASPAALAGAVQMSGSASMAPSPDGSSTNVTLSLANATPGGVHPWSAHWGQCGAGTDGGILGASEIYRPLKVDSDGEATGVASVPVQTSTSGSYFIVVRASVANPETIVACGNLAPPTE